MAGSTDLPFRLLCKEQGCDVLVSEMVSAKAIYYKNKNTKPLLEIGDKDHPLVKKYITMEDADGTIPKVDTFCDVVSEHPVGIQLFGADPRIMADMGQIVAEGNCDFIDINMGCPVPKVVDNKEGSFLMTQPKQVESILTEMVNAIDKPITVKIRKGFHLGDANAVEIARIAEACGVSAVCVHGRTREEYFTGHADWSIIADVKKTVSIPVIGNGDIKTPEDAKRMIDETGCDSIMVGRAARGNPWIFGRIKHFLATGELLPGPTREQIGDMIVKHAMMMVDYKGEYTAVREMRKHIAWYTAGLHGASHLRRECNSAEDIETLERLTRSVL